MYFAKILSLEQNLNIFIFQTLLHKNKNPSNLWWNEGFPMEATAGLEPADKGFADLCLTTWLWRRFIPVKLIQSKKWSGLRGKKNTISPPFIFV